MSLQASNVKYRKDYQAPDYWVESLDLRLDIQADHCLVQSRLMVRRNPDAIADAPMYLDGREMDLLSVRIDGRTLADDEFAVDAHALTVNDPPAAFTLEIDNRIDPDANTALEGFYRSGDILCSQCEAQGFSRITYFPDRPDVMARYRTTLIADKRRYPVLLSNGDCMEAGDAGAGRHYAVWEDPFAKPCYLFAAVAGDLALVEDQYETVSGRDVAIRFYTDHGNEHLCGHGIESLKQAMTWDEQTYGLEYDLDTYMVVAVGSFNMGAMENKGLNIFNTACVLASPQTATDRDFITVRDVIAHEYFHNYTGNRVTCRDWFQLSLKESLTVFREQQFAADHGSPGVTRIDEVRTLRNVQFPEDAGPTAHPVRPESYIEMNNFYTITIYQKGAEVIRMMATILGREAFIAGVRHYLEKHDSQAVTIEDFVTALEESSSADLGQFRLWYSQAGTPRIAVDEHFDAAADEYCLTLKQTLPDTPGQQHKQPMHIPIAAAWVQPGDAPKPVGESGFLHLREAEQQWRLPARDKPRLSLLRDFSAPVKLRRDTDTAVLADLLHHEQDAFARWESSQALFLSELDQRVSAFAAGSAVDAPQALADLFEELLDNPPADQALLAEILTPPTESYLCEQYAEIDVDAVSAAHASLRRQLAAALETRLWQLLKACRPVSGYRFSVEECARRRLAGVCLDYLGALATPEIRAHCLQTARAADNMTDHMAALSALRDIDCPERDTALAEFEQAWLDQPLVLDKWFALQATSRLPGAVDRVRDLLDHSRFELKNPNRVRALLGSFARANLDGFHQVDGSGYRLIADQIQTLDHLNPQIAARLATTLSQWRRYAGARGKAMREQLQRLQASGSASADLQEIVDKSLAA